MRNERMQNSSDEMDEIVFVLCGGLRLIRNADTWEGCPNLLRLGRGAYRLWGAGDPCGIGREGRTCA